MEKNQFFNSSRNIASACVTSCQAVLSGFKRFRDSIVQEFGSGLDRHLLRVTLNEAEAVAQQTGFAHLLFPTLAMEKVQGLREWQRRQEALRVAGRRTDHMSLRGAVLPPGRAIRSLD